MSRPYRPLAFANEFILKSGSDGLEHMKLQKLVYISYGWWLSAYAPSILDESPEVWQHGPVFPSLYTVLKVFGRSSVGRPQKEAFNQSAPRVDDGDEDVCSLLDWVWLRYGQRGAYELSDLTHKHGSPWEQVARSYAFRVPRHTRIPDEIIKEHYKALSSEFAN